MKPRFFIAPIFALLISGLWLGGKQKAISEMEKKSALLRKQLPSDAASSGDLRRDKPQSEIAKPLNWKKRRHSSWKCGDLTASTTGDR